MRERSVEVVIDRLAPGGDGVGREVAAADANEVSATLGRATFVPLTAPGDRVRVELGREKGRVAWGEIGEVLVPSSSRVQSGCAVFGRCGGCQWRHVSLEGQKQAKADIVARALGLPSVELRSPVPQDGYRERARFQVTKEGRLAFLERRAHALVPLSSCPLLSPGLTRAANALSSFLQAQQPGSGLWGGTVDMQEGQEGVHVGWSLDQPARLAAAQIWAPVLAEAGIVGVSVGREHAGLQDVDVAEPGSPPLRIPAGGFAQVSRAANAALVQAVLAGVGAGDPEEDLLELYAGSGNFTRHLVSRARRVWASDGDRTAVVRGRRNVPGVVWGNAVPEVAVGIVVLDPPRAGADAQHLAAARRAQRRVVYVSCDPQTLGRDAQVLRASGFVLEQATAFDLMPQTFHVETVAVFRRAA